MPHTMPVGWGDDPLWDRPYQFRENLRAGVKPLIDDQLRGPIHVQKRIFELCFSSILDQDLRLSEAVEIYYKARYPEFAGEISDVAAAKRSLVPSSPLPASADPNPVIAFELPDDFQVLKFVGHGGFGSVYRAFDWSLRRYVAIKVLKPKWLGDEDAIAMFAREAALLARLDHKQIVTVYRTVLASTSTVPAAIVMPFISGRSLADFLAASAEVPPPAQTASLIAGIAELLSWVHQQRPGVIHRDLKPSNIIMDDDGLPHLIDFGLSLLASGAMHRTEVHEGTLQYMSPEQLTPSATVDGRTDIWGLGVVLYQMLTGILPFRGKHDDIERQIIRGQTTPPRLCNPRVPKELEKICLRCLSREPKDRFSTAADIATRLNGWLVFGDSAPAIARYLKQLRHQLQEVRLGSYGTIPVRTICVRSLIPFEEVGENADSGKEAGETISLHQAVRTLVSFQIIGPSGAGKSVALKRIARSCATNWLKARRDGRRKCGPVPVCIDLWDCDGTDVISAIEQKLNDHGIKCDRARVILWLKSGDCILLLNGANCEEGDIANAIKILEDRCPGARYVFASRFSALPELSRAKRFKLASLTTADVAHILRLRLPEARAREVLRYLVDRGLIEPFRLPILARYLAEAHADTAGPVITNSGKLYQKVIEQRLLNAGAHPNALQFLAGMGHAMVEAGTNFLKWGISIRPQPGTPGSLPNGPPSPELLKQLLDLGLVIKSSTQLRFQPDDLREYFCAVWLDENTTAREAAQRARQIQLPGVWAHYVGVADAVVSREFLKILLSRARRALVWSSWAPSPKANDLLLALRCLIGDPHLHEDLRDEMVRILDGSGRKKRLPTQPELIAAKSRSRQIAVWLTGATSQFAFQEDEFFDYLATARCGEYAFPGSSIRAWYHLMILASRLRTANCVAYVEREMKATGNWAVLSYVRAEKPAAEAVKGLMDDFADDKHRYRDGGLGLARLLLRLPASIVIPAVRQMLLDEHPAAQRILQKMGSDHWLELEARSLQEWSFDGTMNNEADAWIGFLSDTILSTPAYEVRESALNALRLFGRGGLPRAGWRTFYDALNDEDPMHRYRALRPLIYTPAAVYNKTARRLRRLLRIDSIEMGLSCLNLLMVLDNKAYPTDICRFIRRFGDETAMHAIRQIAQAILDESEAAIDPRKAHIVATLLWGAQAGNDVLASRCISAVDRYRSGYVWRTIETLFDRHVNEDIRVQCLKVLLTIAEKSGDLAQGAQVFYRALADRSEAVRLQAVERPSYDRQWARHPLMRGALEGLAVCAADANYKIRAHAEVLLRWRPWEQGHAVSD